MLDMLEVEFHIFFFIKKILYEFIPIYDPSYEFNRIT